VISRFYDFVCEIGQSRGSTPEQLASRIESVDGHDLYQQARELKRGAVLVTAHFGNFEVGLAAICRIEPSVHVVFQRDEMTDFERLRHEMHRRLGVTESPIDEGMASWMSLRDALAADGVVLLQGDRALTGQKSSEVAFFDGHIHMPHGPVRLAMMMNAPLIPVYVVQTGRSRVRIVLDTPIHVCEDTEIEDVLTRLAQSLQRMVASHPDQWHVLHRAWVEDSG
jgi:KDO2-lipid IV(A) lauroyltransferase